MTGVVNVHTGVHRDPRLLHPIVRERVLSLASAASFAAVTRQIPCELEIFETFRHPERQAYLLAQGTTKAAMWSSPHQFGLAADFVPRINGKWTWEGDKAVACFDWLDANVRKHGLRRPISWDRPHVEWPEWGTFRNGLDAAARVRWEAA